MRFVARARLAPNPAILGEYAPLDAINPRVQRCSEAWFTAPNGEQAPSAPAIQQVLHTLRPEIEHVGGSLAVLHRPTAMPAIDAWGSGGDAFPLMLRVKQQFDPRGTLNPGRFIGGI